MNVRPEEDVIQEFLKKLDRFPRSFWLSELLMSQCLSICQNSCDLIIFEAKTQAKAVTYGRRIDDRNSLSRADLIRIESLAFHAVLVAYELLIKRHAIDSRFQSIACNTRVAGMYVNPVLEHSVDAAHLLARMDAKQKVRCLWLLCVLYILQEGPEALVRNKLRMFCRQEVSETARHWLLLFL